MVTVISLGHLPPPGRAVSGQGSIWAGAVPLWLVLVPVQCLQTEHGQVLVSIWEWVFVSLGICCSLQCRCCYLRGLDIGMVQTAFPLGDTESQSSISCFAVGEEALCPSKQAFFSLSSPFSVLWTCCWREDEPLVGQEGWFAARVGLVHLGGLFRP